MNNKYRVLLLDTETKTNNHYLVIAIADALNLRDDVENVVIGEHGSAIKKFEELSCNVFIAFGSAGSHTPILTRLAMLAACSVLWTTEDPYDLNRNIQCSGGFDLVYTNDKSAVAFYPLDRAKHLPLAACQNVHDLEVISSDDAYLYDVLFVGTAWPNRVETIKTIQEAFSKDIKLKIALPYNQYIPTPKLDDDSLIINWRCSSGEYAKLINRSRVVLSLQRRFSTDSEDLSTGSTPPPRLFESALAGGYQVFASDNNEACEYFENGKEFSYCLTEREAIESIKEALSNPESRIKSAKEARNRALREHTYEHRVENIFLDIAEFRKKALLKNYEEATKTVLIVTHNYQGYRPGGGVEVYQGSLKYIGRQFQSIYVFPLETEEGIVYRVIDELSQQHDYFVPSICDVTILHDDQHESVFQRILFEHKVDLVHFQHLLGYPLSLPIIAKASGVPVVWTMHDYYLICSKFNLIDYRDQFCATSSESCSNCDICLSSTHGYPKGAQQRRRNFVEKVVGAVDIFITNTKYSADYLKEIYGSIPVSKIHVVEMITPNFKGMKNIRKPRNEINSMQVMVPGNFTSGKGAEQMIKIFRSLSDSKIEFHVLGWIEPHYRNILSNSEFSNVFVLGGYAQKDALSLFNKYDVSLHLSVWPETYMISLTEAWISGVVPIVTDLGAPGERVSNGIDGFKVSVGDTGGVIDNLQRLLHDDGLINNIRENISLKKFIVESEHLKLVRDIYADTLEKYKTPHIEEAVLAKMSYDFSLFDAGYRTNSSKWSNMDVIWDDSIANNRDLAIGGGRIMKGFPPKYSHLARKSYSENDAITQFNIEVMNIDGNKYSLDGQAVFVLEDVFISGWAYSRGFGRCLDLFARIKSGNREYVFRFGISNRIDVSNSLMDQDALASGFDMMIRTTGLADGYYSFNVIQVYDGCVVEYEDVCQLIVGRVKPQPSDVRTSLPSQYAGFKIVEHDRRNTVNASIHVKKIELDRELYQIHEVDSFSPVASELRLNGWAIWENSGALIESFVRLRNSEQQFYKSVLSHARDDVFESKLISEKFSCGFDIVWSVAEIPPGKYELEYVQVYDGLVVCFRGLAELKIAPNSLAPPCNNILDYAHASATSVGV